MTTVDALVIPIQVDDQDVQRELRRRDRLERRAGRQRRGGGVRTTKGSKGSLAKGGVIGAVAGAVVGMVGGNDAFSAIIELLLNILAAAILPLLVAMLPLFEALSPIVESLVTGLVPLLTLVGNAIQQAWDATVGFIQNAAENTKKFIQDTRAGINDVTQAVSTREGISTTASLSLSYDAQRRTTRSQGFLDRMTSPEAGILYEFPTSMKGQYA